MHNLAHGRLAGCHLCLRARQRVNPLTAYCACAEHRRRQNDEERPAKANRPANLNEQGNFDNRHND